jgi:4-hydroxybenzoate polyprenyltransferase and related prenyltransferases
MITKAKTLLKFTRILDGKGYVFIAIFGYLLASGFRVGTTLPVFSFLVILYIAFAFAINNCYDMDTDSISKTKRDKNLIASGKISLREGKLFSYVLAFFGFVLTALIFPHGLAIYASMLILSYLYSAPPRLKGIPVADMLSHGLFFGVLPFLFGVVCAGDSIKEYVLISISIFFYSCFLEFKNHVEDFEYDRDAGVKTSAVWLGEKRRHVLYGLCAVHMLTLFMLIDPVFLTVERFTIGSVLTCGIIGILPFKNKFSFKNKFPFKNKLRYLRAIDLFTVVIYGLKIL